VDLPFHLFSWGSDSGSLGACLGFTGIFVKTWQKWYDKTPSLHPDWLIKELRDQGAAQVACSGAQAAQVSWVRNGEPRVISAWVETASLLTDLGIKRKKKLCSTARVTELLRKYVNKSQKDVEVVLNQLPQSSNFSSAYT
jgi:hypothetical protein